VDHPRESEKEKLTEPFANDVEQVILILDAAKSEMSGRDSRARGAPLFRQQERLHLVELPVEPVAPDELVVTALLHDFAPEHDKDAVNGADGSRAGAR